MLYMIFAGANGSGKSTLYRSGIGINAGSRVNLDELAQQTDETASFFPMKAGRQAVQMIRRYIKTRRPFNQETTLSGQFMFKSIQEAKKAGFKVEMHYMYVDSPEIAVQRVHKRIREGGHSVPDEVITKRYFQSLKNLPRILRLCDCAFIYDNSQNKKNHRLDDFNLVAVYQFGELFIQMDHMPERLATFLHG